MALRYGDPEMSLMINGYRTSVVRGISAPWSVQFVFPALLFRSYTYLLLQDDFAYRNNVMNADKAIRLGFIRKVYGLLTVQLLTTVAIAAVLTLVEPVQGFIHKK